MTLGTFLDALFSKKGAVLLTPAILLVGTALAIGQNQPAAVPAAKTAEAPPAAAPAAPPPAPAKAASGEAAPAPVPRDEVEAIVKEYLLANPEILLEMQNALEAKADKLQAERTAEVLKQHATQIFRPTFSPVAGNTNGDVPVVEFFDYNCGYCKRAFGSVARLMDEDKQVKFILKEFPILSKGSEEAARVALAAKLQGKYWEFHSAMLKATGPANEASALRVAEQANLDIARLKKDMASPEVQKEIDDTRVLAAKLGIQGTPHFMVGDRIIPGAPTDLLERMTKLVAEVRKEGCKVC